LLPPLERLLRSFSFEEVLVGELVASFPDVVAVRDAKT
jgi:hypothetical protein